MTRRRRRRIKKGPVLLLILFVLGLFFILNYGLKIFNEKDITSNDNNSNNTTTPNDNKNTDKEKTYKLSLLATGDGLIHNAIFRTYSTGNKTFDFSGALTEVKDIVSKSDIAYYNQETPFGGEGLINCNDKNTYGYCGYPLFNTPTAYGDAMLNIGFNMVSLSSNHSLDSGEKGVLNSLKYWKNKENVLYHGMAENQKDLDNSIIIKEKNNITYTMLSYTEMTNGIPVPSGKDYLVNVFDKAKVKKDIESVRDKVDVLIVAMHWGVEYTHEPTKEQKEMAQYLADLGVDIIIGNHPHVLQPITWIDDTLVMYSLGNFISNQYSTGDYSKRISVLATLDINKTVKGDKTEITIDNLGGELIFTHYETMGQEPNNRNHKVIPFSKMKDGTYVKDYKRLYTKYTDLLQSMGTKLNITPLPN